MLEAAASMICIDIIFYLARYPLISLFTTSPEVTNYALTKFTICLLPHFILVSYEITASVLRGMGYSLHPTTITILGSVGFRVLWLFTIFKKWHTFTVLYLVYPASWILTGTMMLILYFIVSKKTYKN